VEILLVAVKSACFNRVKVWLWCHAGILASVAAEQTLSHHWTVVVWVPDVPYTHSHGAASVAYGYM